MKHATDATLARINGLLEALRRKGGLKERRRGIFYLGSQAFLHFHEDARSIFADVKLAGAWHRLPVNSSVQQQRLLRTVRDVLR